MIQDPVFLIAVNTSAAVLARILKPNLLTAGLLAIVLIGSAGCLGTRYGGEIIGALYQGRDLALTLSGKPSTWPPEKHRTFPDLELVNQDGTVTRMSDFRGKVILVEPVGFPCQASVAFAGGHKHGAFRHIPPQPGLKSIDEYVKEFAKLSFEDAQVIHVQLILFNQNMEAPSDKDVRAWARHFRLNRLRNRVVLGGSPSMVSTASRNLVPGFQLIDQDFILRADSTGDEPQDNLYFDLLPQLRELVSGE